VALAPGDVRVVRSGLDFRVLVFAFGASLFASLLFGLAPHCKRCALTSISHSSKTARAQQVASVADRLRSALVVVEIALSVVLLAGAGLLLKASSRCKMSRSVLAQSICW